MLGKITLPVGCIKRIHVHRQNLKRRAAGGNEPVYTVKYRGKTYWAHEVVMKGPSCLPNTEKPLPCGAWAWVETEGEVEVWLESEWQGTDDRARTGH